MVPSEQCMFGPNGVFSSVSVVTSNRFFYASPVCDAAALLATPTGHQHVLPIWPDSAVQGCAILLSGLVLAHAIAIADPCLHHVTITRLYTSTFYVYTASQSAIWAATPQLADNFTERSR